MTVRSLARALLFVVVLLALLFGWALADAPQLYAASFYAKGGLLRAIQLLCTDVLGPHGVLAIGAVLGAVVVGRQVPALVRKLRRVRMSAPALLAVVNVGHGAAPPATDGMNILVLAADSFRADGLDPRVMPNLARFAAASTRFDRAYVSSSRTSFAALSARLAGEGFGTAAVSDAAGMRRSSLLSTFGAHLGRVIFPSMRELGIADPAFVADDVIGALDHRTDRPFFLTASFAAPHAPYGAPAPYYGRFTDAAYRGRFKYDAIPDDERIDDADRAQIRGLYDGTLSSVDDAIGRILAALAARRLDPRTIVVVTGLRGEALLEHDPLGDASLHVPLVIHDPRIATARVSSQIVRDVDLAPTLLELVGIETNEASLGPALRGAPLPPRLAYAEIGETGPLTQQHAIRDERWTLVHLPARTGVRYRLFAENQTTDVAALHPAEVARLRAELWRRMLEDPAREERDGYLVPRRPVPYDVLWIATDAIDDVAARGTRFTNAYATVGEHEAIAPILSVLRDHGITGRAPVHGAPAALLKALDDAGLAERTIVVVTGSVAEDGKVPLLLAGPRLAPGAVVDARCRTTDIAPTVLDILGLEAPYGTSGRSLLRLGDELEPRVIATASTILYDHWRLVDRALFDVDDDPRRDVARVHPDVVAELRARLAAELANTPAVDARTLLPDPPTIRLRFVGGHRVTGTIRAKDAAITPIELGRDAIRHEGDRIDVAFRTDPNGVVGFDLVASAATWDFWIDDAPLHEVFGGPYGVPAPALEHGVTTETERMAAEARTLPSVDPQRDRGLFVTRAR